MSMEEPNPSVITSDDTILYVAVAKDVDDSILNLKWAIHNSGGRGGGGRICILHVHVPAAMIPHMGAKFPASSVKAQKVEAFRESEREGMHRTLKDYLLFCQWMGVRAEKLHIEMDCIEKGIVELITQYGIRNLVMGAASYKCYSRRMTNLRSKKAVYVCERAPTSCHIQFICKGHLIHTRNGSLDMPNSEAEPSLHLRSQSISQVQNHVVNLTNDGHDGETITSVSSSEGYLTPRKRLAREQAIVQKYENERDEELRRKQGEASTTHVLQLFSEFSFSEIEEATSNFNPSLKIGEGGYGSVYKGILRHTEVAIKMLHPNSMQGPLEFRQEVEVLSKLRHPNLITLIGACPESWALVYEYLCNGSLEDRLSCKDNTPPLSWKTRIRIAAELCSALMFLHSSKPHGIVHGDLKPSNILLDGNLVSKLSDFGICRILSCHESSTQFWRTGPKGTFCYMDPEFLASGELTAKSDVYSFGIILLRLLTGRPAMGIGKEVQYAFDSGKLKFMLDPLAGDWPFLQAQQLARLALRCCEMNRKNRPDLYSDVWTILEPMKGSHVLGSQRLYQTPSYFLSNLQDHKRSLCGCSRWLRRRMTTKDEF